MDTKGGKTFQFHQDAETVQRGIEAAMSFSPTYPRNDLVESAARRWANKLAGKSLNGFAIVRAFFEVLDDMGMNFSRDTAANKLEHIGFGMYMITVHFQQMLGAAVSDTEVAGDAQAVMKLFEDWTSFSGALAVRVGPEDW